MFPNVSLLQIPNQKYKISTKTNRVYDITERKVSADTYPHPYPLSYNFNYAEQRWVENNFIFNYDTEEIDQFGCLWFGENSIKFIGRDVVDVGISRSMIVERVSTDLVSTVDVSPWEGGSRGMFPWKMLC